MSPLRDKDKHNQQGDSHQKDRSGLRKALPVEKGTWMFSKKASPEQNTCVQTSEGTVQKRAKEIIMAAETTH